MKLHYTITGKGEPLLFIHGAYINSDIWQYQQAHFQHGYQVITVDLRGHGKSPTSELDEYTVTTFGEDVVHLLDELGLEQVVICGLSLGAMVAQYVASNYPSRAKGIVLVGATASLRLSFQERLITTILFPKWVALRLFNRLSTKEFMKVSFFMTWFMLGNKWLGNAQTRQLIRSTMASVDRTEIRKIYIAVHSFRQQNLNSGEYPVLILNGEHDSPVVHSHSRHIIAKLGDRGELHTIDGSGHACNCDFHDIFNERLESWLERNGIRSSAKVISIDSGKVAPRKVSSMSMGSGTHS